MSNVELFLFILKLFPTLKKKLSAKKTISQVLLALNY